MLQGFSRGVRIPMLLLLVLPVAILFLFYKLSPMQQQIQQQQQVSDEETQQQLIPPQVQIQQQRQPSKYNLMEDTYGSNWAKTPSDKYLSASLCTIEYANQNQLQQDHPCVIRLIREKYLRQPAARNIPYKLDHPEKVDPSDGQAKDIRNLLKNKTNGFFVECGGFDGEYLSNTLFMERFLDWSGLLVEADQKNFAQLLARNRKAYSLPNCLSTKPYPIQVVFNGNGGAGSAIAEPAAAGNSAGSTTKEGVYPVQCFPFYSILLALGRTDVDYFGLDVEGAEYKVLDSIPWHKVNIKTMSVEWNHIPEGEPALTRLMESHNFKKAQMISLYYSLDREEYRGESSLLSL